MAVTVALGNVAPVDYLTNPETGLKTKYTYPGLRATVTNVTPQSDGAIDQARDVLNCWAQMSDEPPSWVSCPESPLLEAMLIDHFKSKQPEGWTGEAGEVVFDIADDHDAVLGRVEVATGLDVPASAPDLAVATDDSAEAVPAEDVAVATPDSPVEA